MPCLCKRLRPFRYFFLCSVRLEERLCLVAVLPPLYKPVRRAGDAVKNALLLPVPKAPAQDITDSSVINWKLVKDQMRYIIAVYGAPVSLAGLCKCVPQLLEGRKEITRIQ